MRKFINKFLTVAMSFMTTNAMVPLSSGGMAYAETSKVTNNVKYFSTTMYNYEKDAFNGAAGTTDKTNNFYFINENSDGTWSKNESINWCYNTIQGSNKAYNVLVQGIVKNELDSKGQIQFNYKNAGVFAPADPKNDKQIGRDVYQNVQFPFVYDSSTGYYTFDSKKNHVYLDKTKGNNQTLPLYDGTQTVNKQVSFFPFNGDNDDKIDYHFGMNMSVPFYMNANGTNSKGDPMVFEFSGDDDVWVFINGKLALDLGGIHGAIGAKINFKTGNITYSFDENDNANYVAARQASNINNQTTLTNSNLYDALGITKEDLAKGENNLQIFYLERGAGASNCKIKFNMQQRDTLQVTKTLGATTPTTSSAFEFKLLKKNSTTGKYEAVPNTQYTLYNEGSQISTDTTTDQNGIFYLKAGQHANFAASGVGGSEYKVVEVTDGYTTEWSGTKETATWGKKSEKENENAYIVPISTDGKGGVIKYTVNCVNSAAVTLEDDTIVLDYGKPVKYNVTTNDTNKPEGSTVAGIGKGDLSKTPGNNLNNGYVETGKNVTLGNGNIEIDSKGIVTYTPTKYMSSVDKANYSLSYQTGSWPNKETRYAYATVNVLPATSVYYEDDFGKINNTGDTVIKWTGKWSTSTSEKTADNEYQGSDNKQYGWDKSYENDSKFSNGSAHVTTINEKNPTATAEFTFTGTGVDIYTKTDSKTGTVIATIYRVENGTETLVDDLIMDNKSVSDKGNGYYQIPTLYFENLHYGTYRVQIMVTNQAGADKATYYLDGIRVYNPLGVAPTDPIVKGAYKDAHEYNATYKKVRDILISAQDFNAGDITDGAVFIDEGKDENGNPSGNNGTTTTAIKTYEDIGPKNEVYLKKGQAIAFQINGGYDGLFIGAKAPNGTTTMVTTNSANAKETTIATASDMYYPITAKSITDSKDDSRYVMIKNTGDNILAITKIRATGENYTMKIKSPKEIANYASTFSQLKVSETDSSGMVLPDDKGDVDIDNPGDKDNDQNKDDNKDEDNNATKPNTLWDKIANALKKWFGR